MWSRAWAVPLYLEHMIIREIPPRLRAVRPVRADDDIQTQNAGFWFFIFIFIFFIIYGTGCEYGKKNKKKKEKQNGK